MRSAGECVCRFESLVIQTGPMQCGLTDHAGSGLKELEVEKDERDLKAMKEIALIYDRKER